MIFKNILKLKRHTKNKHNAWYVYKNKNADNIYVLINLLIFQINVWYSCVNYVIQIINIQIVINVSLIVNIHNWHIIYSWIDLIIIIIHINIMKLTCYIQNIVFLVIHVMENCGCKFLLLISVQVFIFLIIIVLNLLLNYIFLLQFHIIDQIWYILRLILMMMMMTVIIYNSYIILVCFLYYICKILE